jgi:hypothetical protein
MSNAFTCDRSSSRQGLFVSQQDGDEHHAHHVDGTEGTMSERGERER